MCSLIYGIFESCMLLVMSRFKSEAPPSCCSTLSSSPSEPSTELKLYQAFIFSVPVFFTFILLLLFYLFYLRRRRVDWASIRMQANLSDDNEIVRAELGLKKEVREMLPIIVYKESFSVRETQCLVCLGDYQAEDRLQQIPACGHTFHMECIDHWLANHTTCPICRLSLVPSAKVQSESPNDDRNGQAETGQEHSVAGSGGEIPVQRGPVSCEESGSKISEQRNEDSRSVHEAVEEDGRSCACAIEGREFANARNESEEHEDSRNPSA